MIQKIKQWWHNRKLKGTATGNSEEPEFYTRAQMEKVYALGHADGKKEGLAIARQQAINSVKALLKESNK